MRIFLTTLFVALSTALIAQVGLTFNLAYQPTELEAKTVTAGAGLEFRIDVDKHKYVSESDAAFVLGARYGVATSYSDFEAVTVGKNDYLFIYARGYAPMDLNRLKLTATIQYDPLNDDFFLGGGIFQPIGDLMGLTVEIIARDFADFDGDDRRLGIRAQLAIKIGK